MNSKDFCMVHLDRAFLFRIPTFIKDCLGSVLDQKSLQHLGTRLMPVEGGNFSTLAITTLAIIAQLQPCLLRTDQCRRMFVAFLHDVLPWICQCTLTVRLSVAPDHLRTTRPWPTKIRFQTRHRCNHDHARPGATNVCDLPICKEVSSQAGFCCSTAGMENVRETKLSIREQMAIMLCTQDVVSGLQSPFIFPGFRQDDSCYSRFLLYSKHFLRSILEDFPCPLSFLWNE